MSRRPAQRGPRAGPPENISMAARSAPIPAGDFKNLKKFEKLFLKNGQNFDSKTIYDLCLTNLN